MPDLDGRPSLVAERLLEHLGPAESSWHDHLRRDRRGGGVVLQDELLGHLGLVAAGGVLQVEALAVGQHAVAHLEHLRVCVRALGGHGHGVERAHRLVRDPLPLQQAADGLEAVAQQRRLLELLVGRGLLHLPFEVALDLAVATGEEGDDRLDAAAVLLLRHVAHARGLAALDEVVEAGAATRAAGLGAVAGAELEDLAQQVERLPYSLRIAEWPEVGAAAAVLLAREVDAREVLVEGDRDVGIGLVVSQPDVVAGAVLADEGLLGEQGLGLRLCGDELDVLDLVEKVGGAACGGTREVALHALLERLRLAHVEHAPAVVAEQVDARRIGQRAALGADALLAIGVVCGVCGHLVRGYGVVRGPMWGAGCTTP